MTIVVVGNKISDKITSVALQKTFSKSEASSTSAQTEEVPMKIPSKKYMPSENRQQTIDELRLL